MGEEGICPFAKKGLKMWKEREAKKGRGKKDDVAKVEIDGPVKMETIQIKTESPLRTIKKGIAANEESPSLDAKSPIKAVKKEIISGYQVEHFSSI